MSLIEKHGIIERNATLLLVGSLVVVSIGGIVEIAPLFYLENTIEKVEGMRPYSPLELAGLRLRIVNTGDRLIVTTEAADMFTRSASFKWPKTTAPPPTVQCAPIVALPATPTQPAMAVWAPIWTL